MAAKQDLQNALQKKAEQKNEVTKKDRTIKDWIMHMESDIKKALPSVITVERFTRMAITAVNQNPKLASCTPRSFMGALMTAAQLGLEPNTPLGQAYVIPFKNKGVLEATFQLGYRGLIELAHRSGEMMSIQAHTVHENDEFEYEYGLEPKLKHIPALDDRGEPIQYYCVFKLKSGGSGFEVMSKKDVINHAKKYSQSFDSYSSPWKSAFDAMAKKTVAKQALNYAPISVEFRRGVATDGSVKESLDKEMIYEDNSKNIFLEEGEYNESDDDSNDETPEVDKETGEVKPKSKAL